jgi:hypothetical protein
VDGLRCGQVVVLFANPAREREVITAGTDCVAGARFGAALAAGHLDPDLDDNEDLVVGSPETATDPVRAGSVYLFRLVRGGFERAQLLRQKGAVGMRFGAAIAIGNFDGSRTGMNQRERQLAIGAPYRTFLVDTDGFDLSLPEAGAVFIYRPATNAIDYTQVLRVDGPAPAAGNHLGEVLAPWRRSDSSADALVAGLPDAGASGPAAGKGRVEIYDWTSLTLSGQTVETLTPPSTVAAGDRYGAALAVGNFLPAIFGGPGFVELVIGAPGTATGAGAYHVWNIGPSFSTWRSFLQSTADSE